MKDLKGASSHFQFGKNWQSYVDNVVDEDKLAEAERGLEKLVSRSELAGKSFLDIGSGSGLSMLAAIRLGVGRADGIDIDADSVRAAQTLLGRYAPGDRWIVRTQSVFDLARLNERYDIVHSWGVLHHTGAMWEAIDLARSLVADGGLLVLALYRKTPLCGFWRLEKSLYHRSPRVLQAFARLLYKGAFSCRLLARRKNPVAYARDYGRLHRGMDWDHDIHDWLGGYPYESVSQSEMRQYAAKHGLQEERAFASPPFLGLWGSTCDEYVFRCPTA
jgi:2-polyprenyl-6-hydroxyphenyl methylase/3-demethylubiquinone-9 3-methyltransferase